MYYYYQTIFVTELLVLVWLQQALQQQAYVSLSLNHIVAEMLVLVWLQQALQQQACVLHSNQPNNHLIK